MKSKTIIIVAVCFLAWLFAIGGEGNNNASQDTANKFCESSGKEHLLLCKLEDGTLLESGVSMKWFLNYADEHSIKYSVHRPTKLLNKHLFCIPVVIEKHIKSGERILTRPMVVAHFVTLTKSQSDAVPENYVQFPLAAIEMSRKASIKMVATKLMQRYPGLQIRESDRKKMFMENDNIEIILFGDTNMTYMLIIEKKLTDKFYLQQSKNTEAKMKKQAQKELDF